MEIVPSRDAAILMPINTFPKHSDEWAAYCQIQTTIPTVTQPTAPLTS